MENNSVPIKNQIHLPHLSESIPNNGLRSIPVKVEAETMKPKKVEFAPNPEQKEEEEGFFPSDKRSVQLNLLLPNSITYTL